eukprot:gene13774-biopygen9591
MGPKEPMIFWSGFWGHDFQPRARDQRDRDQVIPRAYTIVCLKHQEKGSAVFLPCSRPVRRGSCADGPHGTAATTVWCMTPGMADCTMQSTMPCTLLPYSAASTCLMHIMAHAGRNSVTRTRSEFVVRDPHAPGARPAAVSPFLWWGPWRAVGSRWVCMLGRGGAVVGPFRP